MRSQTGSNLRSIHLQTGVQVLPGLTQAAQVKKHRMFPVPVDQLWKVPLLHSIVAIRAEEFKIQFDDDDDDVDDIVNTILVNICTS